MKKLIGFTFFIGLLMMVNLCYAEWTIVQTIELPENASGLAYDGEYIYCGIYGVDGGNVYKVDLTTGDYELAFTGPHEDAYGLTYDGQYLWTTDHPNFGEPAAAMKLDWSGNLLDQFDLPDHYMSGIAYDNAKFWVATYYPDPSTIYQVDINGAIQQEFTAPDNQPWDLCVENEYIWMADYWGDTLYRIDPSDGSVVESHDSESTEPAGIVYDGEYLWYCDNGQSGVDYLYKVDLGGAGTPEIELGFEEYDFGYSVIGDTTSIDLPISNNGDANLEITGVECDESEYSAIFDSTMIIEPGDTDTLTILFAPEEWGEVPAIMTIDSNDPVDPSEEVSLNGYGIYQEQQIYLPEDYFSFSDIRVGAYSAHDIEIINTGMEDLVINEITFTDSIHFFLDQLVEFPITISMDESADIKFWFTASEIGSYDTQIHIYSNDEDDNPVTVDASATTTEFSTDMGTELWTYLSNDDYEKITAMEKFIDLNGDGYAEVLLADNNYGLYCMNGNASGTGDVIWSFSFYIPYIGAGSIYQEQGLTTIPDINDDGIDDVIAGTAWGSRAVFAIDGSNGQMIWYYDTDDYSNQGDGGWVYEVDAAKDYSGDGINDVLAAVGDDGSGTGPRAIILFDGTDGSMIWDSQFDNSQCSVSSIEDTNGDDIAEVIAGETVSSGSSNLRLLSGSNGNQIFAYNTGSSAIFTVTNIDDVSGDGIEDICYGGNEIISARSSQNAYLWSYNTNASFVTCLDRATNNNGEEFILPSLTGSSVFPLLNTSTGDPAWTYSAGDYILDSSPIGDLNSDEHFEIMVGTLGNDFLLLSGSDGAEMFTYNHSDPIEQTVAIDDIDDSNTPEMMFGDRDGYSVCFATGEMEPSFVKETNTNTIPERISLTNYPNPFNPTTTIRYQLPKKSDMAIKIYDINGRLVKILVEQRKEAGYYSVQWNGLNEDGNKVSSGVYFYRLETEIGEMVTEKMVLMK